MTQNMFGWRKQHVSWKDVTLDVSVTELLLYIFLTYNYFVIDIIEFYNLYLIILGNDIRYVVKMYTCFALKEIVKFIEG